MTNICLIDDDQNILASLSLTLKSEGYNIKTFSDGLSGLTSLQKEDYDIVILDIKMPRLDGLEVLQELRQTSNLPVIFLTSKDEEIDQLLGLKMGADDYITKPFSQKLLLERVKTILRRSLVNNSNEKSYIVKINTKVSTKYSDINEKYLIKLGSYGLFNRLNILKDLDKQID